VPLAKYVTSLETCSHFGNREAHPL
jgi:hypothetical protein